MSFTRYKATSNTPTKLESVKGPIAYSDSTIKLIRAELARILNDQFEPTTTVVDWSITPEEEVDPTLTQDNCHHGSPSDLLATKVQLVPIGHTSRLKNPTNNIDATEIRTSLKVDKVLSMLDGRLNKI